jgi:nickel/cobalt exporter
MSNENRTKLRTLLNYWIEHNKEHSQEFKEWAGKAEGSGEIEISKEILEAVRKMDEASEYLLRALKKLEQKEL